MSYRETLTDVEKWLNRNSIFNENTAKEWEGQQGKLKRYIVICEGDIDAQQERYMEYDDELNEGGGSPPQGMFCSDILINELMSEKKRALDLWERGNKILNKMPTRV